MSIAWKTFLSAGLLILAQCYANADSPQQCFAQSEDYLECLHRTKEVRHLLCFTASVLI